MSGISNDVTYSLRQDISEKIHRMPLKYFESKPTGEVLSRITNDVDTLGQSLNQSVTQLITSVTTLIGVFIMMLRINVVMTMMRPVDPSDFHADYWKGYETFSEIFPTAAGISWVMSMAR